MDINLELGSCLSLGKDDNNVLSNDALHYNNNTCSEEAPIIIKELIDDSLSMNDDTIIK